LKLRKVLRLFFRLVFVAAIVAGAYYGGAYSLPDEARAERHVSVPFPPEKVAPLVMALRNYPQWLAWKEQAADIAFSFAGPATGSGQTMHWTSASPVFASGEMASVAVAGNEAIELALSGGIFKQAKMKLALAAVDGGTGITWTITMPNETVIDRWRRYFGFEPEIAPSMVKSLANLKAELEKLP
jgi:Polyketide cyclase / dehydrase and lipid transport